MFGQLWANANGGSRPLQTRRPRGAKSNGICFWPGTAKPYFGGQDDDRSHFGGNLSSPGPSLLNKSHSVVISVFHIHLSQTPGLVHRLEINLDPVGHKFSVQRVHALYQQVDHTAPNSRRRKMKRDLARSHHARRPYSRDRLASPRLGEQTPAGSPAACNRNLQPPPCLIHEEEGSRPSTWRPVASDLVRQPAAGMLRKVLRRRGPNPAKHLVDGIAPDT